jgi:CHAD domain-containing protein
MAKAKHIAGINSEGAAADAIHLVLITRFEEMCALRDHALDWSDPEGVHDMRVSSRRLRGALRDFAPYLHKRKLSIALKQLREVADALGAVRDQDVAIMSLQKLSAGAPPEVSAMLDELVRARETIRKQARKDLRQALLKGHLRQLQKDFVTAMDSATGNSKPGKRRSKNADARSEVTYREVARRTITERLKDVEKLSDGLYQPLRVTPLHKMRIAAKRLRYALELFDPCWGAGIRIFGKRVAALQSSLGELHDSDIWIEAFGKDLNGVDKQPKDRAAAALWLLSHFVRLHSKHLRNTLEKWRDWEANEVGIRLRDCLQQDSVVAVQPVDTGAPKRKETESHGSAVVGGIA